MTAPLNTPESFSTDDNSLSREQINKNWLCDESELLTHLLPLATLSDSNASQVSRTTQKLITVSREKHLAQGGLEAFLQEYDLSSQEGVVLMCLAEALLRIPDNMTADRLIQDKLGSGEWSSHLGQSPSFFVNASTWGLMLTGGMVALDQSSNTIKTLLNRMVNRSGEAVIRTILREAMHTIARQFILGSTMPDAIKRSLETDNQQSLYSFDMLGEAAISSQQAQKYFDAYSQAIAKLAAAFPISGDAMALPANRPGISIKLSALHPRMETSQRQRVLDEVIPSVIVLCEQAMQANIGVTFDAEESNKLDLQLDIFQAVFQHPKFLDWAGLGLAVQAYQKRALAVIDWLIILAGKQQKIIMLRLVKGAYWDTEIKQAQYAGLTSFPVFTRKENTDISYLACARRMAECHQLIYSQFATHNAQTIASVINIMQHSSTLYEFQCLHGMGKTIYDALLSESNHPYPLRIYAPVGDYQNLLPYLVRRLLENGANTSFLNQFADTNSDIQQLIISPEEKVSAILARNNDTSLAHPSISTPADLFKPERQNSVGLNLDSHQVLSDIEQSLAKKATLYRCGSLLNGKLTGDNPIHFARPDSNTIMTSEVLQANNQTIKEAVLLARSSQFDWQQTNIEVRIEVLNVVADLIEKDTQEFLRLLTSEGGRCISDAASEIREAVDFCRYYAVLASQQLSEPYTMSGPAGETNQLFNVARGVYYCISPWNFPLAIFTGQIAAALVCGNSVIAKPAHQTSAIAYHTVKLFHKAGTPSATLQLLTGDGQQITDQLLKHDCPDGICFTGSIHTANSIHNKIFKQHNIIVPIIAETGGLNCMIADSSTLPEQLVLDVIQSAFNSAGQRCSALRILYLQQELIDKFIPLLCNAMEELIIGLPNDPRSDIGPVIDQQSQKYLENYIVETMQYSELLLQMAIPIHLNQGHFVPPCIFLSDAEHLPKKEIFGPILHIVSYESDKLDDVIQQINSSNFGLTLGIHSRIQSTVSYIASRINAGNVYVNRNMISAVVGLQPFGGIGLSGTGPKAGGPHYLRAFTTERTLSINNAAIGGDTNLMSLGTLNSSETEDPTTHDLVGLSKEN
ncbi:Proline dehydrogenase / Delta-1-pyrroline-5-carboxylate dehydrogenase [hydrothermal vent metagenome]|uniref:L-glutamate gamma-semialdehyde dehydrogenase n=1 Tax=hydrothermal vent metagenome TaxID=652676 RepID=A0A3B0YAT3_9ZZZZ